VHAFFVVALVVIVGGLMLSGIVGRFSSRAGTRLGLVAGIVARLGTVVAMIYATHQTVNRGGWLIALAVLFVLIAVGAFSTGAILAGALWLSLTGRTTD
jgi:hypothetical protein